MTGKDAMKRFIALLLLSSLLIITGCGNKTVKYDKVDYDFSELTELETYEKLKEIGFDGDANALVPYEGKVFKVKGQLGKFYYDYIQGDDTVKYYELYFYKKNYDFARFIFVLPDGVEENFGKMDTVVVTAKVKKIIVRDYDHKDIPIWLWGDAVVEKVEE